VIVLEITVVIWLDAGTPSLIGGETMREFLLRGPPKARSLRGAAGAAFLLIAALVPLSGVAVPQEVQPTPEPDAGYNDLVAKHLRDSLKNLASLDGFAISAFRWVSSLKGWSWMACVRFEENRHPRMFAVFIKDGKVIDSRYAVQIDDCNTQTYVAFGAMGPTRAGVLGPLY
jgi:hypothetical protein